MLSYADRLRGLSAWDWGIADPLFMLGSDELAGLGEIGSLLEITAFFTAATSLLFTLALFLFMATHLYLLLNGE